MHLKSKLSMGAAMMAITGLGTIADAVMSLINNFAHSFLESGVGPEQVNVGRAEILTFSPSLFGYISHLHVIVSGLEAALGLVLVALAWYGIRRGYMWAWITTFGAFLVVLAAVFPVHHVYGLATFSHLGMNYMGALMFLVGAFMALGPLKGHREPGGSRQVQPGCPGLQQKEPHDAAVGSGSHVG